MIKHEKFDANEVAMFVEYIQKYIISNMDSIYEECAGTVVKASYKMVLSPKLAKELHHRAQTWIADPHAEFSKALIKRIDAKIAAFFSVDPDAVASCPLNEDVFAFNVNGRLINEYYKTQRRAEVAEKLINETLGFAWLDHLDHPAKKLLEPVSPGGIYMGLLGLDIYSHRERSKKDICRRLNGIGKNINMRIRKRLLAHYSSCIHRMADARLVYEAYEAAS